MAAAKPEVLISAFRLDSSKLKRLHQNLCDGGVSDVNNVKAKDKDKDHGHADLQGEKLTSCPRIYACNNSKNSNNT